MDKYKIAIRGNGAALRIDPKKGNNESDRLALEKLEESFYDNIGFGDKFHRLHQLKNEKALLEADYVIENNRFNLNLIRIKEMEINDLESKMKEGLNIDESKAFLDKKLGFSIKLNETTVIDFFTKLEFYGRN